MDSPTLVAIVALLIACAAILVATAQVLQQYFQTGYLIRLCDSVVFGPLPGRGHRVWVPHQFRFKILYSVPQICLPSHFWPTQPPHKPSFATGKTPLPQIRQQKPDLAIAEVGQRTQNLVLPVNLLPAPENDYSPGEASWVSFCRAIEVYCGETVRFDMVAGDADRCPADLPTVPMQVSLRDIVAMALAAGMECTYASFEQQSVFMQGKVGSITSGRHPILGPLVHFTPRWPTNLAGSGKKIRQGILRQYWLQRVWGTSSVAGQMHDHRLRRAVQRLDERWLRYTERMAQSDIVGPPGSRSSQSRTGQDSSSKRNDSAVHRGQICNYSSLSRPQDGSWTAETSSQCRPLSSMNPSHSEIMEVERRSGRPSTRVRAQRSRQSSHVRLRPSQRIPVIIPPNRQLEERIGVAQRKQAERAAKSLQIKRDSAITNRLINSRAFPSPYHNGVRLLRQYGESTIDPSNSEASEDPTTADEEAHERESMRLKERQTRDGDRAARKARVGQERKLEDMSYFWLSQIDIFAGYWATPWRHDFRNLNQESLVGAITVIFESVLGFLGSDSIIYFEPSSLNPDIYNETFVCMLRNRISYPSYAHNSMGGVVSDGLYLTVKIDAFEEEIPVLELLHSYDWQIEAYGHNASEFSDKKNVELFRLDSWLSITGRMAEISDGNGELLKQAPAVVELLLGEFEEEWSSINRSANEGGLQEIQDLAASVMDFLTEEELSPAEQLFLLIATLRTLKVGQCVYEGQDTKALSRILADDVQVHLV